MNKYKQNIGIFIIPAVSVVVVILLLIFGIKPSLSSIFEAQRNFSKNQERLALLTSKANELANINEEEVRLKVDKLSLVIPADKSIPGLLTGLERMAAEASAAVEKFSINPGRISTDSAMAQSATPSAELVSEKKDVAPYIEFQITLVGNFNSLRSFLTRLANSSRILGVKSVVFTSGGMTGSQDTVSSVITLKAYYLPYPAFLGEITDPVDKLTAAENTVLDKVSSFEVFTIPPSFGQTGKTNPFSRF